MKHSLFDDSPPHRPPEIAVVAVPGASLLTLAGVCEPLAVVARRFPHQLRLTLTGETAAFPASGTPALLAERIGRGARIAAVFVCGGMRLPEAERPGLRRLLRACARAGTPVLCLGSAVDLLAEAGHLRERKAVAHWRRIAALAELNAETEFSSGLYLTHANVTTCAGGAAALDMTIAFLDSRISREAAEAARAELLAPAPRPGDEPQPGSPVALARRLPRPLEKLVARMAAAIERPVPVAELCRTSGLSQRQVERLFRAHLGVPPGRYYAALKLDRARQLLENTGLALSEIAVASGHGSAARLTRSYRQRFGLTPAEARRRTADASAA